MDTLNADDLVLGDDGSFEIVVSRERPQGAANWLRSVADPPTGLVLVRQTYLLREQEELATMTIALRGVERSVPTKWSARALDDGLASTGMLVAAAPMMFARWAQGFQRHTNQLPLFDQATSDAVGGDPTIRYFHSYWSLASDEALIVHAQPPECTFWNMQINNHFSESLDYRCVWRARGEHVQWVKCLGRDTMVWVRQVLQRARQQGHGHVSGRQIRGDCPRPHRPGAGRCELVDHGAPYLRHHVFPLGEAAGP